MCCAQKGESGSDTDESAWMLICKKWKKNNLPCIRPFHTRKTYRPWSLPNHPIFYSPFQSSCLKTNLKIVSYMLAELGQQNFSRWNFSLLSLYQFWLNHQTFGTVLQHDNTRPHAARHTTQFLTNNNIHILPLSSTSSVLNTNKHTWNELQGHVWGRINAPANVLCFRHSSRRVVGHPSPSDSQPDPVYA